MKRPVLATLTACATVVAFSCKAPTQMRVTLLTNVPSDSYGGFALAVGRASGGAETAAPALSGRARPTDGYIGSVIVGPAEGESSTSVALRLVVGVHADATSCKPPLYEGCIVARRRLSYVPNVETRVRINADLRCENHPCGKDSTCYASPAGSAVVCVSSETDPGRCASADGCDNPDELSPVAGVIATDAPDAGSDGGAAGDASADARGGQDGGADGSASCAAGDPFAPACTCSSTNTCGGSLVCRQGTCLGVREIGAGYVHTCVLLNDGTVHCYGRGALLGYGDTTDRVDDYAAATAMNLGTGRTATAIATSRTQSRISSQAGGNSGAPNFTCAILDDGSLKCWGAYDPLGTTGAVLGDEPNEVGDGLPVVPFPAGRKVKQVEGGSHFCAVLDDGSVWCWGANGSGELGVGGPGNLAQPFRAVNLGTGRTAKQVAVGATHTCALLDNGKIRCWGSNAQGELGVGDTQDRGLFASELGDNLPFVRLPPADVVAQVYAFGNATCARMTAGQVKCWGNSALLGQGDGLPRGTTQANMDSLAAIDLGAGVVARDLSFGTESSSSNIGGDYTSAHICALVDGGAKCWGLDISGGGGFVVTGDAAGEMGDALGFAARFHVTLTPARLFGGGTGLDGTSTQFCVLYTNGRAQCDAATFTTLQFLGLP